MTANPDLRRYPFDNHTLPIIIEPKVLTEKDMVFVIDDTNTGLNSEADLPGWTLTGMDARVTNQTYVAVRCRIHGQFSVTGSKGMSHRPS